MCFPLVHLLLLCSLQQPGAFPTRQGFEFLLARLVQFVLGDEVSLPDRPRGLWGSDFSIQGLFDVGRLVGSLGAGVGSCRAAPKSPPDAY